MNATAVIYLLTTLLFTIGGIALFFYKSWLDYFRPDWFYIYNIFDHDFFSYKEHKIFLPLQRKKDSYKFDKEEYSHKDCRPYVNSKGVYVWNFKRGLHKPVYFVNRSMNIDAKLISQAKTMSLDDIWFSGNNIQDFLKEYGLWIVIGLIVILFLYLINQNQQTTRILLNVTR